MKKLFISCICIFSIFSWSYCDAQELEFVKNKNQWDNHINYQAEIKSGKVFFTNNSFRYAFYDTRDLEHIHHLLHEKGNKAYDQKVDCYAYDMKFIGANPQAKLSGIDIAKQYRNYFIGNDQSKWAGNVPVFRGVHYQNIYNQIDIAIYSQGNDLKYDYVVKPNGVPSKIEFAYTGILPTITKEGSLKFDMPFLSVAEAKPITYQILAGQKKHVKARYVKKSSNSFGIEILEPYDKQHELIIDPTLIFATYSGSTAMTFGFSATYGPTTGYLYAGGQSFGVGWPTTTGAYQVTFGGGQDAGINVYDANGTTLIYSTYFGGSGSDLPNNMIVNDAEELAICGSTTSANMPTTTGCYDNTHNGGGSDVYVTRFNSAGSAILGSTYVGGSGADATNSFTLSPNYGDANRGEIFYDAAGNLLVAASTSSTNFPVTAGAYQSTSGGQQDGCIFRLSPNCSSLLQSTYLGGSSEDACFSIGINSLSEVIVCGGTTSGDFPTTTGAYATTLGGGTDGFVSVLDPTLSTLNSSTFLGTAQFDHAFKIQVDNTDTIYVCGQTEGAFPVSPGAYTDINGGTFIAVVAPNLSTLTRSTRIGANMANNINIVPAAFLKDNCGNIYFTGYNGPSTGLPTTPNALQLTTGGFWLSVLDQSLSTLVYASYFATAGDHIDGGTSRFDPQGVVYQSVCCGNNTFPVTPGVHAPTKSVGASWDVASYKIDFELSGVQSAFTLSPNDTGCAPHTVIFNNNSVAGVSYMWYFGDGDSSSTFSPSHVYTTAGNYTVMLITRNVNSCIPADTAYSNVFIRPDVIADFTSDFNLGCSLDTVRFTNTGQLTNPSGTNYNWDFGDANTAILVSPTHIYGAQNVYTVECIASDGFCADTFSAPINILHPINADFDIPTDSVCLGNPFSIINTSTSSAVFPTPQLFNNQWDMGDGTTLVNNTAAWTYTYSKPGAYTITLQITDTLGCIDTFSINVYVDDSAFASFSATPLEVCLGEYVQFTDQFASHALSTTYDFDDGTVITSAKNPRHTYQAPGTYNVSFTGNFLVCPAVSESITITVNEHPLLNLGPDISYCPGLTNPITLSNIENPNQILQWSDGSTGPTLEVDGFGRFWATVANLNCVSSDSIWVKRDCYLNIPNSFSPNADGRNDYFIPRQLLSEGLKEFSMKIFNRWGELIFETDKLDGRGWDGKYGGDLQPVGVYVYIIDAQWNNNYRNTFKGNVTLMR